MTKSLLLLRHAQSAGTQGGRADYERPLTPEGLAMANKLGVLLLEKPFRPDYILASSARRTKQTVQHVNKKLGIPVTHIRFMDELYEASTKPWRAQIGVLPSSVSCALLVGHNPTLSELASLFAKELIHLPSGGLIGFKFLCSNWNELSETGEEITRIMNQH